MRQRNHCSSLKGIPKMKLQDSGPSGPKSLQSQNRPRPENRLSISRLDVVHAQPVITALAALAGAAIGGLTSVVASWLTHRSQAREQRLAYYQLRRQNIYKEFIELASKLYIHALQNDKSDVSALMGLYAEIAKMRALSSA